MSEIKVSMEELEELQERVEIAQSAIELLGGYVERLVERANEENEWLEKLDEMMEDKRQENERAEKIEEAFRVIGEHFDGLGLSCLDVLLGDYGYELQDFKWNRQSRE